MNYITIKPGCSKRLAITITGLDLNAMSNLTVLLRAKLERGTPLISYSYIAGVANDAVIVENDKVILNMPPDDTSRLPAGARVYMDLLPDMIDGVRPSIPVISFETTTTLVED